MSRVFDSWVEVTIPNSRMADIRVQEALDNTFEAIGGCTLTEGRGYYKHNDGRIAYEGVTVARWDFNMSDKHADILTTVIRELVHLLLGLGEESVLRRRHYPPNGWYGVGGYRAELIYPGPDIASVHMRD